MMQLNNSMRKSPVERVTAVVRGLLIASIVIVTAHLLWQIRQLAQPSPGGEEIATEEDGSQPVDLFATLMNTRGYWSLNGMDIALRFDSVTTAELTQRWQSEGAQLAGKPADWEPLLNQWFEENLKGAARTRGDFVERQGEFSEFQIRCLYTRHPESRPCLIQVCWPNAEGNYALIEVIPTANTGQRRNGESLLAVNDELPLARRFSEQGELTGEIYRQMTAEDQSITAWDNAGIQVLLREERDGIIVYELELERGIRLTALRLGGIDSDAVLFVMISDSNAEAR